MYLCITILQYITIHSKHNTVLTHLVSPLLIVPHVTVGHYIVYIESFEMEKFCAFHLLIGSHKSFPVKELI